MRRRTLRHTSNQRSKSYFQSTRKNHHNRIKVLQGLSIPFWLEQHGCLGREHNSDSVPLKMKQLENRMHVATGSSSVGAVLWIRDVNNGSRILIFTHPGSRIADFVFRIPDPKTVTKERGENIFFVKPFFVATNFTKL